MASPTNSLRHTRTALGSGLVAGLAVLLVFAAAGYAGVRGVRHERRILGTLRESLEASTAPGEMVVVDDRLLAWALRQGHDGVLRESVWAVSEDAHPETLRARLRTTNRREMVLVARPDDQLVLALDADGFAVAQEVGWVPWDLKGDGRSLLGRGRMRIYFVVAPRVSSRPVR